MRVLSPLARPVFNWNHRMLMTEGGEGLAHRLSVPLLAEIVQHQPLLSLHVDIAQILAFGSQISL